MATVNRFEDLEVWKLAREQASEIYEMLKTEPLSKDFSLRDLMNASSGSLWTVYPKDSKGLVHLILKTF